MTYPPSYDKAGNRIDTAAHRTLIIEIYKHKKPIAVPEYTHEAFVTVGAEKKYFYGYSDEHVLAAILSHRLENKP